MKRIWELWKEKWGVKTNLRMTWIFIIFAITGSSTVVVRKWLYQVLGIDIENRILSFIVYLVAVYLVYQPMLFTVGSILGEHKFVKWFLIKMNSRMIGIKDTSSPPQ